MKYLLKYFCILYVYIYDYIFNKYKDILINYLRYLWLYVLVRLDIVKFIFIMIFFFLVGL